MVKIKTEIWNNYKIRFVEKDSEWWAVGKDVAKALGYIKPSQAVIDHCKGIHKLGIPSYNQYGAEVVQETSIIPELDIYNLIFKAADQSRSKKVKERAEEFKTWVFKVLKELREASGLEAYQLFTMFDKDWQKEQQKRLHDNLPNPTKADYIKANVISNKAVSTKYGHAKMLKKKDMTPEMLADRQSLLEDTVQLMIIKEKFNLNISVSEEIYKLAGQA